MAFTFQFLGREYGPTKLFFYSLPLIRAYNNNASLLLCSALLGLNIASNKIFGNKAADAYVKKSYQKNGVNINAANAYSSLLSTFYFMLQCITISNSKNLSNTDILLSSVIGTCGMLNISNKSEEQIHISSIIFISSQKFLCSSISNYCVNELLKYQLTPVAQLFALPLAQFVVPDLAMKTLNPVLNYVAPYFMHEDHDKPIFDIKHSFLTQLAGSYICKIALNCIFAHSPSVIKDALFGSLEVAQDPLWL